MATKEYDIIIVGGGAAGFFAAINCAEANPSLKIAILERGNDVLQKVKISGGGRCNLTHACFQPRELIQYYPRGSKALLGPFHQFACQDTVEWFANRGVETKTEADGRMFPVSNSSATIVDCLMRGAKENGVEVILKEAVDEIQPVHAGVTDFEIRSNTGNTYICKRLMIAAGSSPKMWGLLRKLGLEIVEPVPSLFTFNIKDPRIEGLSGLSVQNAHVKVAGTKLQGNGPLLITHWGMSGPAILKMSAFGARDLHARNYAYDLIVSWTGLKMHEAEEVLHAHKNTHARKSVWKAGFDGIPNRLWQSLATAAEIPEDLRYSDLPNKKLRKLAAQIAEATFKVNGKSTFKEEFVTAGGVELKEINFKRFESKRIPGLFFAGEILNIDGVTGGFNFQAAWTGGFLAGQALAQPL